MKIRSLVVSIACIFILGTGFRLPAAAEEAAEAGDKWAVVIGISKFNDPSLDLKYAANDARDFYDYLITDGHFAADHVSLLLDEQATRKDILSAIGDRWLPTLVKPQDLVVVYLSTHGSPADSHVGGVNYLITQDTTKDNLYGTGIAMQDLSKLIKDRVPAQKVVLILDACHSGTLATDSKGLIREANLDAEQVARDTGKLIISSSEPSQTSWESKDRTNGVFTYYLIEGLKQKGNDTRLSDAFNFMKEKVQEEVLRDRGAMQTPVMRGDPLDIALAMPSHLIRSVPPELVPARPARVTAGLPESQNAVASALPGISAPDRLWESNLENGQRDREEGRYADADKPLGEALKLAEKFGDQDPRLAATLNAVAELKTAQGKYSDAEPLLRKALSIREKGGGKDAAGLAETLNALGKLLLDKGRYTEANAVLEQALSIREKTFGADSRQVGDTLNIKAQVLFEEGKFAKSEDAANRALSINQKATGSGGSAELAASMRMMGKLSLVDGRPSDARKSLLSAMEMQEKALGSEHPALIDGINALAELYTYQNKLSEAEPLLYKSLALSEQSLGPDHPAVADSVDDLALIYELKLKYPQADSNYKRALDIREKALGSANPSVGQSLINLAWLKYSQEDFPQADSLFRKAQAVIEKSLDPANPKVISVLEYYSYLLNATSRRKQASQLAARIKELKAKNKLENPKARGNIDEHVLSLRVGALAAKQKDDKHKRH